MSEIWEPDLVKQEHRDRKCPNPKCESNKFRIVKTDTERVKTDIQWDCHVVTWKCNVCRNQWAVGALHDTPINPNLVYTIPFREINKNQGHSLNYTGERTP